MSDNEHPQTQVHFPKPNPDLKNLDKLLGTWKVSGPEIEGEICYEWMEGGFFMIQHIDFVHSGHHIKGLEIIGHIQLFGLEPSKEIKSRYYGSTGETFDYVYEIDGDTLTIWGGEKGSPAYYKAQFGEDGNSLNGAWVYPNGGGYESNSIRIK